MTSDEHYEIFKRLAAVYDDIESGEADHPMILKRNRICSWLSKMEDGTCLEALHTELVAAEVVNPNMQTLVYCGSLITDEDTEAKWDFLFAKLLLFDLWWLDIIAGVDEESTIEDANRARALTATVNAHTIGFETAYQYILDNFVQINTTLGSENTKSIIRTLANKLTNTTHPTQLNTLFNSLTVDQRPTYQETFEIASATIVSNGNLLGDRLDDIKIWVEDYDSSGITFSISISLMLMALLSHLFM
ncbi:hypothetical protein QE152_g14191 [Popillia japonica]|uniref:Uncharacterized protein n=1 Tax=Popillia japonica TaxID=7064 RepID=A0AAW1LAW2_POPJA